MSFEVDAGIPSIVGSRDGLKSDTSGAIPADQDYTFAPSFPVNDWYRIVSIDVRLDATNSAAQPRLFLSHVPDGDKIRLSIRDTPATEDIFLVTGGGNAATRIESPALQYLVSTIFPPSLELNFFFRGKGAQGDTVRFQTRILWTGD